MGRFVVIGFAVLSFSGIGKGAPQLPPESPPPGPFVVVLNIQGEIERPGKPSVGPDGMKEYFAEKFAGIKREAEKRRVRVDTNITLRVSRDAPFRAVYNAMEGAKGAGFTEVTLASRD